VKLFSDEYLARRKAAGQNDPWTALAWWMLLLFCPVFWAVVIWWIVA